MLIFYELIMFAEHRGIHHQKIVFLMWKQKQIDTKYTNLP